MGYEWNTLYDFIERQKADRLAMQIETQIKQAEDAKESEKLKEDLHVAQVDILYAKFFRYREQYVSLYPEASLDSSVHGGAEVRETQASGYDRTDGEEKRPNLDGVQRAEASK
ncbi:hypothetical protein BJ170DRAFT_594662 [Xylariales sp. AK1849]|nr:hypothetical protein BJ170DRAFT_594662 [Xylariales sp. AK1849]